MCESADCSFVGESGDIEYTMLTEGQNDSSGTHSLHNVRIRNRGRTTTDLKAIQNGYALYEI